MKELDELYKDALIRFKIEDFKTALKLLNKILKRHPNFELGWIRKGETLNCLNRFKESLNALDKALELNPNNAYTWICKVHSLLYVGTLEENLECCNRALKLEPNKYWGTMAQIYERFKQFNKALEFIEKELALNPTSVSAQKIKLAIQCGLTYGDYFFLPITRSEVLLYVPDNDEIFYTTKMRVSYITGHKVYIGRKPALSSSKIRSSYWTDAVFTPRGFYCKFPFGPYNLKYTLVAYPIIKFTLAFLLVGKIRFFLNKTPSIEAESEYSKRRRRFKKDISKLRGLDNKETQNLYKKGAACARKKKYENAIDYYDKILKIYPDNISIIYCKILALKALGRNEEAVKYVKNFFS